MKKKEVNEMSNFLTLTIIFKAGNLNYGESTGNISALKKLSFKGKSYTYISRQALRYDIVRIMNEEFSMPLTPVGSDGKVVQFEANAKIDKYPEIDLFGYMKTSGEGNKGKIRKAIVRLSDAISLEQWNNDIDYGNNMGLAARTDLDNMIFQSEIHRSFYTYTMTIELKKIGIDPNNNINLDNKEKIKRINLLLDSIKILYRDIRGRREDLSPLFIIGGIYEVGNPFFYNKIELNFGRDITKLNIGPINETLEKIYIDDKKVKDNTKIGYVDGIIANLNEIKIDDKNKFNMEDFFVSIKNKIKEIYK
jgi:CRISPR-associated protein Cst2